MIYILDGYTSVSDQKIYILDSTQSRKIVKIMTLFEGPENFNIYKLLVFHQTLIAINTAAKNITIYAF